MLSFVAKSFVFQFAIQNLKIKIYRIIILPVVLCGCESWSRTLREESRLRVFENRVLRRIFGPNKNEVTGKWRKLYNEELNPYPTAFPYGNGMVLHFYQQQESSTTKTVHKVINKRLKTYV